MNVFEMTKEKSNPSIWIFIVVAAVLMLCTVGPWTTWSKVIDGRQRRRDPKTPLNAGKADA